MLVPLPWTVQPLAPVDDRRQAGRQSPKGKWVLVFSGRLQVGKAGSGAATVLVKRSRRGGAWQQTHQGREGGVGAETHREGGEGAVALALNQPLLHQGCHGQL